MPALRVGCVIVLLVSAGCLGGVAGGGETSTERPDCPGYVNFYLDRSMSDWESNLTRVKTSLPADTQILFIAFEGDAHLGTTVYETDESGVELDGYRVPLAESLVGNHTIRVTAYVEADRDGQFDPETDRQCSDENGVVQAGPQTFNFSTVGTGDPTPGESWIVAGVDA